MIAFTVILLSINAILICFAGLYLTVRIHPRLYTTSDISGKNQIDSIQDITGRISNIQVSKPELTALRDETANVIVDISNTFVDIKVAIDDSVKRAKIGMRLLIVSAILQTIVAYLQIITKTP
jgi:hypothetical protein